MISRLAWVGMAGVLALSLASCSTTGPSVGFEHEDVASDEADSRKAIALEAVESEQAHAGFPEIRSSPMNLSAPTVPSRWKHHRLPGKQATLYAFTPIDKRLALSATAVASASMLRQSVYFEPGALRNIRFSWKVPALIAGADLTQRETHDAPVRVALSFAGDRAKFSLKNAMFSELAQVLTGEPLPYATLTYVWCNACTRGSVLVNPRTDRIREIVLESGPDHLGQWQDYERDIRADFERAFGESPGALLHVGLMTDTDNSRESATAWYGPISLTQ